MWGDASVVFDMFNEPLRVNDRVKFIIDHDSYEGIINLISPSGFIRIDSVMGEYRRKSSNVIKIK